MEIHPLLPEELIRENGADGKRLMPWPAMNAPFEGAWVVLEPGGETGAHSHHEYEMFVVMTGEATVEADGAPHTLKTGCVAYFPPGTVHRVINSSADEAFSWYAIWWDPEMSSRFAQRHEAQSVKA